MSAWTCCPSEAAASSRGFLAQSATIGWNANSSSSGRRARAEARTARDAEAAEEKEGAAERTRRRAVWWKRVGHGMAAKRESA
jgi:hypothetical protein